MPIKKSATPKDDRKGITYRTSQENWKVLQGARIQEGTTMQALIDRALRDYLRKKKLGELVLEESE